MIPEKCPFCEGFYFDELWAGVYHMLQCHDFLLRVMVEALAERT